MKLCLEVWFERRLFFCSCWKKKIASGFLLLSGFLHYSSLAGVGASIISELCLLRFAIFAFISFVAFLRSLVLCNLAPCQVPGRYRSHLIYRYFFLNNRLDLVFTQSECVFFLFFEIWKTEQPAVLSGCWQTILKDYHMIHHLTDSAWCFICSRVSKTVKLLKPAYPVRSVAALSYYLMKVSHWSQKFPTTDFIPCLALLLKLKTACECKHLK